MWLSQPCQARRCEKRFISGPQQCSCMQGTAHERLLPSCNHSGTAPGIHSHSASYQLRPDGIQLVVELLHLRLLPRLIQHLGKLARNASAHPSAPRQVPCFGDWRPPIAGKSMTDGDTSFTTRNHGPSGARARGSAPGHAGAGRPAGIARWRSCSSHVHVAVARSAHYSPVPSHPLTCDRYWAHVHVSAIAPAGGHVLSAAGGRCRGHAGRAR